ncbi:hypothetical protein T439DRAFT_326695 [Meredithblackwellia eburnea MCA 4105]
MKGLSTSPPPPPPPYAMPAPTSHRSGKTTRRSVTRSGLILTIVISMTFLFTRWIFRQPADSSESSSSPSSKASRAHSNHRTHLQLMTNPLQFPLAKLHDFGKALAGTKEEVPLSVASCEVCVADPTNPLCEYGLDNVRLSRSYQGSGFRVRKVIEKALRGETVRIGIIGASVSCGHGLRGRQKWFEAFLEDFKKMFPKTKLYDGSSPGMNSQFYSYCFESLLPRDLDLYLVELDINNEMKDETYNADDQLMRGLLGLPQEPAVIRVSVFALAFADLARGLASGLLLSQYFDIPMIGIRNFLLPHLLDNPDKTAVFFSRDQNDNTDLRHIGDLSHKALGDMLAIYMREQVCEVKRRERLPPRKSAAVWPSEVGLGKLPRMHIWDRFDSGKLAAPVNPICAFLGSETRPLVHVKSKTEGKWRREDWNGKSALTSSEVGARAVFEFTGTKVGVFVWKNNGAGNLIKPGMAGCWIDDEMPKALLVDAYTDEEAAGSKWTLVAEGLPYGKHTLSCEILSGSSTDGHDFRILGVASL